MCLQLMFYGRFFQRQYRFVCDFGIRKVLIILYIRKRFDEKGKVMSTINDNKMTIEIGNHAEVTHTLSGRCFVSIDLHSHLQKPLTIVIIGVQSLLQTQINEELRY